MRENMHTTRVSIDHSLTQKRSLKLEGIREGAARAFKALCAVHGLTQSEGFEQALAAWMNRETDA